MMCETVISRLPRRNPQRPSLPQPGVHHVPRDDTIVGLGLEQSKEDARQRLRRFDDERSRSYDLVRVFPVARHLYQPVPLERLPLTRNRSRNESPDPQRLR